jgi:hypothetical protein
MTSRQLFHPLNEYRKESRNYNPIAVGFNDALPIYKLTTAGFNNETIKATNDQVWTNPPTNGEVEMKIKFTDSSFSKNGKLEHLYVENIGDLHVDASNNTVSFHIPFLLYNEIYLYFNNYDAGKLESLREIKLAWNEFIRSIQENHNTYHTTLQEFLNMTGTDNPLITFSTTEQKLCLDLCVLFPQIKNMNTRNLREIGVRLVGNKDTGAVATNNIFCVSSSNTNQYANLRLKKFVLRPIINICDPVFQFQNNKIMKSLVNRYKVQAPVVVDFSTVGQEVNLRTQDLNTNLTKIIRIYGWVEEPALLTTYNDSDSCNHKSGPDYLGLVVKKDGTVLYDDSDPADIIHRRRRCNQTQMNIWGNQFLPTALSATNDLQMKHCIMTCIDFTNIYRDSQNNENRE